ncbi:MAG: sigma-70 family RNA polymerase sigma factor [Anaerolineae bacterium]|nr:sigma-70 family RNA polymerase sigma factor [Anaerolineae bacterium]
MNAQRPAPPIGDSHSVESQERAWAVAARHGDEEAFAKLVKAYQRPIYNLAYRMLGSPSEAEDATQETFLRAYTRLHTYDSSRKFSSWILSIGSHYCIDRLRRRRGKNISMEEIMSERWLPDDDPRPEQRALANEREALIQRMLQEVAPQYREVLILRYWHDHSYEDIAEITHASVSAVKSRLHRARNAIADALENRQADDEEKAKRRRSVHGNALSRGV